MSDERLRELERRWKESGSEEDEAAWLVERVRSGERLDWGSYSRLAELSVEAASEYLLARVERGELEQERLELAAYCSHQPARVALGQETPEEVEDLAAHVRGLMRWGLPAVYCGAASVSRLVMDKSEEALESFVRPLEAWVYCPCPTHAAPVERLGVTAEPSLATEWAVSLVEDVRRHHQVRPEGVGRALDKGLLKWALTCRSSGRDQVPK